MKRQTAMSRLYHPVLNQVLNVWVAVAENARGRGKSILGRKLIAVPLVLLTPAVFAAPTGGQISAGAGAIAQAGTTTTIAQKSQNLAIDWNSFSIAANETVRFNQSNPAAIALNRVLGQNPSQILGSLSANGQVFILNPNGTFFGKDAQVNVGGLLVSTLRMSNADFMAGNYRFKNTGKQAGIVNQGALTAADGGYIALLAPEVHNEGVITATLGTALLAAGDKITLNINNGSLLGYSIDQGALNALVENRQLIQANGGQVIMSAKAANQLATAVVNNTGIIEARTVQNHNGTITLLGDMQVGQVNVGGTLDASAPDGGDGGFIDTSAAHVNVADTAQITTLAPQGKSGTWLIDPLDYTIASSKPNKGSYMSNTTLSNSLGQGNVKIQTATSGTGNGDIFVNSPVSWSANTTLTLSAYRNVNVNSNITATGNTAGIVLAPNTGGSGGSYSLREGAAITLPGLAPRLTIAGNTYTVINRLGMAGDTSGTTLQGMNGNLAGYYALGSNIDATATSGWNAGAGFKPVGDNHSTTSDTQFTGVFDGLGHNISNLVINRPTESYVGLFGYGAGNGIVQNVGMVDGSVKGSSYVGGLMGYNQYFSSVYNSRASNSVTGGQFVGGLVGYSDIGTISKSHTTGSVSGDNYVGGLVGGSGGGNISKSYTTGSVSGGVGVGGLVGNNGGIIINSYSTSSVSGNTNVGGLVGMNFGNISFSYAAGSVSGTTNVGGLVGFSRYAIYNSYWDKQTSGQSTGIGGGANGLNTSEMKRIASFTGWSISKYSGTGTVWFIKEYLSYPQLNL